MPEQRGQEATCRIGLNGGMTVGHSPATSSYASGCEGRIGMEGGTMLRKHILKDHPGGLVSWPGEKDIAALATVLITSEAAGHPIDHVFDRHRGPGGSRWVAGEPGTQTLLLAFDTPQTLRTLRLEIEEREVSRTQELHVAISRDGGHTYHSNSRRAIKPSNHLAIQIAFS